LAEDALIRIASSTDLVDGGVAVRFEVARHGRPEGAFAIRHHGRVHAYLNRCGHVPMELDWQPGHVFDDAGERLVCATHGALYDPADGQCLGGPCRNGRGRGRGLVPLQVVERDGLVYWQPREPLR